VVGGVDDVSNELDATAWYPAAGRAGVDGKRAGGGA